MAATYADSSQMDVSGVVTITGITLLNGAFVALSSRLRSAVAPMARSSVRSTARRCRRQASPRAHPPRVEGRCAHRGCARNPEHFVERLGRVAKVSSAPITAALPRSSEAVAGLNTVVALRLSHSRPATTPIARAALKTLRLNTRARTLNSEPPRSVILPILRRALVWSVARVRRRPEDASRDE
jgi:hypothetical protein